MRHGTRETEIKLAVPDVAQAQQLLRKAGFRLSKRRVFESNQLFDTPGLRLRTSGTLLRIRDVGRTALLTYKGPVSTDKHKSREELELNVSDAPMLAAILEKLGFEPMFLYEKFRTVYCRDAGGEATLDETPIGVFLELEGSPDWIDRTAERLGFREEDYITLSYARLYVDWCAEHQCQQRDMIFAGKKRGQAVNRPHLGHSTERSNSDQRDTR